MLKLKEQLMLHETSACFCVYLLIVRWVHGYMICN